MGWNPAIAHLGCTCVCIIDYKCNYQWFVWWDQNANEGISWAVCSLFAKEDSLLVFSVSSTSAFQEGTCHMIVRTFQIAESRGKGWITQQLSYPRGVEFLKVLRRILQEQLGWERDRGFQKYCYDLSILVTLLRKAGEMLWKHILIIALCFFANGPYKTIFQRSHFVFASWVTMQIYCLSSCFR